MRKGKYIQVQIDAQDHDVLKALAKADDRNVSAYVKVWLKELVKAHKAKTE